MTAHLLAAAFTRTSTGEAVTFWILAPIALGAAIAMILARSAVHGALLLVVVFFCFGAFYFVQEAPFLGAVQIIVYAGAIMILFLFVLMLVGVDSSDSLIETLRGQRVAAIVLSLGFAGLIVFPLGRAVAHTTAVGLGSGGGYSTNVETIAQALFTTYVFPFEVTSALLIIAAVGAMVLGHRERTGPRPTQRDLARRRFAGRHPSPLPGPGVYATHDAVDAPALLPSGEPAPDSYLPEYTPASVGGGEGDDREELEREGER